VTARRPASDGTVHEEFKGRSTHGRAPYSYVKSIRIVAGARSDDCDQTDGLTAYAGNLGSVFPQGLLVCQDGDNEAPGTKGNQDFKLVPLQAVTSGS
jgi:myo-inositol-hexaphosphate 3-phosphohydrolase